MLPTWAAKTEIPDQVLMTTIPALIDSLSKLAWPLLAAVLLWKLYPSLHSIVKSKNFKVKIGDMEVSVQQASDQLAVAVNELQQRVAQMGAAGHVSTQRAEAVPTKGRVVVRRVLWVDDKPENNALEIAGLRRQGIEVRQATSTADAMKVLASERDFDAIVSDMARYEGGHYRPKAGIALAKAVREAGFKMPVFVYSSAKNAQRNRDEILAAGANGATGSTIELFEMLRAAPAGTP